MAERGIFVNTWVIEGIGAELATWLREKVAPNGGLLEVEPGRVVLDEAAVGLLLYLDADVDDGAIERTDNGLVMYAGGNAYPVRPAGVRGLHFHET